MASFLQRRCPLDVLGLIFQELNVLKSPRDEIDLYYNNVSRLSYPMNTVFPPSQVCLAWRKAAHSTHQLFNFLWFQENSEGRICYDSLDWWLKATRKTLIHVHIDDMFNKECLEEDVLPRLLASAYRWKSFVPNVEASVLMNVLNPQLLSRAINLTHLHVSAAEGEFIAVFEWKEFRPVIVLPRLNYMIIRGFRIPSLPRFGCPALREAHYSDCVIHVDDLGLFCVDHPLIEYIHFGTCNFEDWASDAPNRDSRPVYSNLKRLKMEDMVISLRAIHIVGSMMKSCATWKFENVSCHTLDENLSVGGSSIAFDFGELLSVLSVLESPEFFPGIRFLLQHSPNLIDIRVEFDYLLDWPEIFPKSVRLISLKLCRRTSDTENRQTFEESRLRATFTSAPNLEELCLGVGHSRYQHKHELSFTPFIRALQHSKGSVHPWVCPKLGVIRLFEVVLNKDQLLMSSRQRNGLDIHLAATLEWNRTVFLVTLTRCPFLPQVDRCNFAMLEEGFSDETVLFVPRSSLLPVGPF